MMLVIVLLVSVVGVVAINYRSSLLRARFDADVKGVETLFKSAKEALLVGFDPFLSFSTTEKGAHVLLQEAGGGFPAKGFVFSAIKKISLDGAPIPSRLVFASKGTLHPQGTLLMEGEGRAEIFLASPIQRDIPGSEVTNAYPLWVKEKFKEAKAK